MELVSRTSCRADLTTDLEADDDVKEGDGTDNGDDDDSNILNNPFDDEEEGLVVITVEAEDRQGVEGHDESPFFVGDAAAPLHHQHVS
jgi:hypothetical protein